MNNQTEQEFFEAMGISPINICEKSKCNMIPKDEDCPYTEKNGKYCDNCECPSITPEIILGLMLIHTKLTGGYIVSANCKTLEDIKNEVLNTLMNDKLHERYWQNTKAKVKELFK